jgi:hypothetical protein
LSLESKGRIRNILLSKEGGRSLSIVTAPSCWECVYRQDALVSLLKRTDYYGIVKFKKRVSPNTLTPREEFYLRRFGLMRKL